MSFIREFLWLFPQASVGCFVTPFLWIPLVLFGGLTVWTFVTQRQDERKLWKQHWWTVLAQLLFCPAIVLVGVSSERFRGTNPLFFELALYSSLVLSALVGGISIYRMKGAWSAISLVVTHQFILLGASFVAGMAISGDWL